MKLSGTKDVYLTKKRLFNNAAKVTSIVSEITIKVYLFYEVYRKILLKLLHNINKSINMQYLM